jgi:glycyl-tRNA synthetase beta chain
LQNLPARQEDLIETIMGPPKRVSFNDAGEPTPAALAFVQKNRVALSEIKVVQTPKGEYLSVERRVGGEETLKILQRVLPAVVSRIQFPKTMYWTIDKFRFARPIRWILALYQNSVVRFGIADVRSSGYTCGHRFLGKPKIKVTSLSTLQELLSQNGVIADPEARKARIVEGLAREAAAAGGSLLDDPALLRTVINLNEYPSVIRGSFDERFLSLPQEILITVMREHQKYFAVLDERGQLLPHFLAVINLQSDPDGTIRAGHERVLRARLADAEFFWTVDRKVPLIERETELKNVVYQEKLGTYYDKTQRVISLLPPLAEVARCSDQLADLRTAGHLLKCDLVTEMVKEFTDLQGIVGGLYARAEAYPEAIWRTVYEQYQPGSASSPSPSTRAGAVLSLADRLDTVCGCFVIGLIPSGSKDPFAVRRQGNAILKIILDHQLTVSLERLVRWGLEALGRFNEETAGEIRSFLEGRLRFLLDEAGCAYDSINAAFAAGHDDPLDTAERVRAIEAMRGEPDFLALASSFKRIANILTRAGSIKGQPDVTSMSEAAEIALWERSCAIEPEVAEARARKEYDRALRALASLRSAVDTFFEQVLVMAEDPAVRANRLSLLKKLAAMFLGIADISQIVIEQTN